MEKGDVLHCQWHASEFDAKSGKALSEPAPLDSRLITLPIAVHDGKVFYKYP